MWSAEVKLGDDHRLVENNFGAFIQYRHPYRSAKYAVGSVKPRWRTLNMYPDLETAFKAWYSGRLLDGAIGTDKCQTAAGDPSEAQETPIQGGDHA